MPTVVRVAGIRFIVWPNDHMPPHAHAVGAGWQLKIAIGDCESIKPWLLGMEGRPSSREITAALRAVKLHCMALTKTWRELHG